MHWLHTLAEIRSRKLELARLDPRGGMPVQPPAGASPRGIAGVERKLGRPLPPSYAALLAAHDGWPGIFQRVGLLGVHHLSRGSFVGLAGLAIDRDAEQGAPEQAAARAAAPDLVPFGIDPEGETLFAWDLGAARADGELGVILWANQIGERFESFPDLLDFLLEMLVAEIDERLARDGARSAPRSGTRRPSFAAPLALGEARSFRAA